MIKQIFYLLITTVIFIPQLVKAQGLQDLIEPCTTPEAMRQPLEIEVFEQYEDLYGVDFYVQYRGSKYHAMRVIEVKDEECKTLFSDIYVKSEPLSAVMSMEAAKHFRLSWETRQLERYDDREVTQKWLKDRVTRLSPESQWAYKELGFTLRKDIKTCPKETPDASSCF